MTALVAIMLLIFVIGSILAFFNRSEITRLKAQVKALQQAVEEANYNPTQTQSRMQMQPEPPAISEQATAVVSPVEPSPPNEHDSTPPPKKAKQVKLDLLTFDALFKGAGLFWLGAIILSLGGIFLAIYAIEAGLLPAKVRIIGGALFGITLIGAAHFANRFADKLGATTAHVSAALASGGVVTCYAMALVSYEYYQLISPGVAFLLLAIVSLGATYLALKFGPILAAIGIVGAYVVPWLVSSEAGQIWQLLLYVAFVSLAAQWVGERVKQKWLWWFSIVGHFGWFAVAIFAAKSHDFLVLMVFAIVSIYLYSLLQLMGWKLAHTMQTPLPLKALLMPREEQLGIALPIIFIALYLFKSGTTSDFVLAPLCFALVMLPVAVRFSAFDTWPHLLLLFALCTLVLQLDAASAVDAMAVFSGPYLYTQVCVVVGMGMSLMMMQQQPQRRAYLLLLVASPLCFFAVSYALSSSRLEPYLQPVWACEILIIAAMASFLGVRAKLSEQRVAYFVLANTMLALCFTLLLSASALTIAVAAQVASMSYLSWKYKATVPAWLYKLAIIAITIRLTVAPWWGLGHQGETIATLRWTLVIYPCVLALLLAAYKYTRVAQLKTWFTGVMMHIVALFITSETSYYFNGDYPDFMRFSYGESITLAFNWLLLACVYLWRAQLSASLRAVHQSYAYILMFMVLLLHLDISVIESPFIYRTNVGTGIVNWLFLQWLMPAVVLLIALHFELFSPRLRKAAYVLAGLFFMFFINGEIRSIYHDGLISLNLPTSQSELYTYSVVWLVISASVIFFAQYTHREALKKLGFMGLALVVIKAFMVDMASLEGLLRAISFIGLGLSVVAIGWLFQVMQTAKPKTP